MKVRQRSLQFQIIIPTLLIIILTLSLTVIITESITKRFAKEYAQKRLQGESIELELLITLPQETHLLGKESTETLPFAIFSGKTRIVFNIDNLLLEKLKGHKFKEGEITELEHDQFKYYALKKKTKKATIYVLLNEKDIPGLKSLSLIKETLIGGGLLVLILTAIILRSNKISP